MHAASKATFGSAFAMATPDKPPGPDVKAKKAAADKRKAAATTTTATGTKPNDGTIPPTEK
jgi:hypothetical protein